MNISIRKARQTLYNIDSPEAEKLRRDLFELENQDATLPLKFRARYQQLTSPKKEKKDMKQQTLLKAATDMLLNRNKSTVSENISPSVLGNLDILSLNKILDSATDAVFDKYVAEANDQDITSEFRALLDDIEELDNLVRSSKELNSFIANQKTGKIKIKEDESLELTGAILEEISHKCDSLRKVCVSIKKLCDGILDSSYTDFNSVITNFSESTR